MTNSQRPRPRPAAQKTAAKNAIVQEAMPDARRAIELATRLQRSTRRDKQRRAIANAIQATSAKRQRVSRALRATFFANFIVLGTVFFAGAGLHVTQLGDALTAVARIAALTGMYLLLVQLLLISRIPVLDQLFGMDRLTRWHKVNGHVSFNLILTHIYLVIAGRAMANGVPFGRSLLEIMSIKWVVPAVIGFVILVVVVLSSIRKARRKLGHRNWLSVHKWTYLGVALSFGHMLSGPDYLHRPAAQAYLWAMFVATFGVIGYYRILLPVSRAIGHQLHVAKVVEEGPGVYSIYMTGRRLDKLAAKAGHFCYWRFLTPRDWAEAHPYSLSAAPNDKYLRITVKSLGDSSSRLAQIPKDTWVTFEGPFGAFTEDSRVKVKTLLIAGGIGITPVRSLMEGMPVAAGDMAVIYRANKMEDAVLLHELEELASARTADLHVVLGQQYKFPADRQPLSPEHIRHLIPDILHRDVYICAAPGMTAEVRASLKTLGLDKDQIHHQTFA